MAVTPYRPATPVRTVAPYAPAAPAGVPGATTQIGSPQLDAGGSSGSVTSPWNQALQEQYNRANTANPYGSQWQQGIAEAMALGGRDWEGALRGFAQEDVARQNRGADALLRRQGMSELALRGDVQSDRARLGTDATTRAMIAGQGLRTSALAAMQSMLSAASGAELQRLQLAIQAASAGGSNYNQFQQLAIPLQMQLGAGQQGAQDAGQLDTAARNAQNEAYRAQESQRARERQQHDRAAYDAWLRQIQSNPFARRAN